MNEHLQLVVEFHEKLSFPMAEPGTMPHFPDMEVIRYQSLLMETGSEVLKAIMAGEMAEIMLGLANLAYVSLSGIARQGRDVIEQPISWRQDGFVLSVMQIVSDKINQCSSGSVMNYSALYCLCIHLARGFVNADFNKAFQMIHHHYLFRLENSGESFYDDTDKLRKSKLQDAPDLSESLYE